MAPDDLRVDRARAALLLVDFQERLAAVMAPGELAACERNITLLIELARQLQLPVVLSEQYPKGLGPTVAGLKLALAEPGLTLRTLEKVEFACTDAPGFAAIQRDLGRDQWIVVGMEAHVCVYQTARGLAAGGARVHVPADAVISRSPANARIGLELCARAGAIVTATETVVFDALRRAGTEEFRALSRLVK
jgi:nicotinamidase-related amidase